MQIIPFKTFMAGSSLVDGGLTFLSVGACVLVLIILEKMGVTINERLVRFVSYGFLGYSFLLLCVKFIGFL